MTEDPLAVPADRSLLQMFVAWAGIDAGAPGQQLLREAISAFSRLPYENLTKIIKAAGAKKGHHR